MTDESTLATQPAREAQEPVAWRAVAHPKTGMGTMVNQIKHRLTEDADSLYGKGRWTLEELVPRATPPDAAATIERRVSAMDAAKQARDACMALGLPADPVAETFAAYLEAIQGTESEFREAIERAGMTGDTYIVHALDEWVARAERAEAELAVLRPGSRFTVDGVECVVVAPTRLAQAMPRIAGIIEEWLFSNKLSKKKAAEAMLSACEEN